MVLIEAEVRCFGDVEEGIHMYIEGLVEYKTEFTVGFFLFIGLFDHSQLRLNDGFIFTGYLILKSI